LRSDLEGGTVVNARFRKLLEARFRQWSVGHAVAALSAASLLGLSLGPEPASAQSIEYGGPSVTANGTAIETSIACPASDTPISGVIAGCVSLEGVTTADGFAFASSRSGVPARVVATLSGSILTIAVKGTTITGPAAPAVLTLVVSANFTVAGSCTACPAGTAMSGFFFPPPEGESPAGDNIQVAAVATGKIINGKPLGDKDAFTPVSLPSICAGTGTDCVFTASDNIASFGDRISQGVQCGEIIGIAAVAAAQQQIQQLSTCSLTATIRVTLANPGDTVHLPVSVAQVTPDVANNDPDAAAAILDGALLAPMTLSPNTKLHIKPTEYKLTSVLTLGVGSNGIDPSNEFVTLRVGAVSRTIPAGSFHAIREGKSRRVRFAFQGTIRGVALKADITRVSEDVFGIKVHAKGVDLTGTTNPVPVEIVIDDDRATDAVIAKIKRNGSESEEDED